MQPLDVLRSRPHTSVSEIKTFITCPRKHSYTYVERIKPDFRPVALSFGTAWHVAIGQYLLHGTSTEETTDLFRDVLARDVLDGETPVVFEDAEDLGECIDLGTRMVDAFIGAVHRPDHVLGVEMAFSIELEDSRTGELLDTPLIGSIDAIVTDNDKPAVWELKSSKKRWSADQLENDLQVTAYRLGARVLEVDDPALMLLVTTKAKKPTVQVENVIRTERDENELVRIAASVMRAVDAGVDHPIRSWACKGCPYSGRCC